MFLASNLQYLRKSNGSMTQEKLAQRMGVSRQTVSKWESGEASPEIGNLLELCDIFSCTLDDLIREDMTGPVRSSVQVCRVPGFWMAQYIMISPNAMADVREYMDRWCSRKGLETRCIHWGFPYVSAEQKTRFGLQGHGAACLLPGEIPQDAEDVRILRQEEASYAVLTLRADETGAFPESAWAYRVIMEYLADQGIAKRMEAGVLPSFQRDYEKEGILYRDVFVLCEGRASDTLYRLY